MKNILIIQDNPEHATRLELAVKNNGGIPTIVVGRNSSELLPLVKRFLRKRRGAAEGSINFDGILLDILFHNEPDGGINLWLNLTPAEKARAGKLVIVTNSITPHVQTFAATHAGSRCFPFTMPRLGEILKLHLF